MVKFNTENIINPVNAIADLFDTVGIETTIITPTSETPRTKDTMTKTYIQQIGPNNYVLEMHFPKKQFQHEIAKLESVTEPGCVYDTKDYVFKGYKLYDLTFIKETGQKIVFNVTLDAIIERKLWQK